MKFFEEYLSKFTKTGAARTDPVQQFASLCEALGDPQDKLKFVHIAGTNGKGSIAEYMACALEDNGERVGKFTSPYILTVNERIQVNGKPISDEDFDGVLRRIERCGAASPELSQFEVLTAAAFLHFLDKECSVVVLEAGIGGLHDCTNIVRGENVLVSIIGAIGLDHVSLLGGNLRAIAEQKAGIIKTAPCVLYPGIARRRVFEEKCRETGAKLIRARKPNIWVGSSFRLYGMLYSPAMRGEHQAYNAITAVYALHAIGVYGGNIRSGLSRASLMGRMQRFADKKSFTLTIDGAHNPQGLAAALCEFRKMEGERVLAFGMVGGKEIGECARVVAENAADFSKIIVVGGFAENALDPEELGGLITGVERGEGCKPIEIDTCQNVPKLLEKVQLNHLESIPKTRTENPEYKDFLCAEAGLLSSGLTAKPPADEAGGEKTNVLVAGSLYLAGEVIRRGKEIGLDEKPVPLWEETFMLF